MEFSKEFCYEGEKHNFWEMVYIDKGEMICTADQNKFTLKSGEITFHQPNEFHNLEGNKIGSPNVSIITFVCSSPAMKYFSEKIFKLNQIEKNYLSLLFEEGLSCYEMADKTNPLIQKMSKKETAPFGSSQMTKNLLEMFLIMLSRNDFTTTKKARRSYNINGIDVPYHIKDILDYMQNNIRNRITVKDIANHIHQSESQTKKLFGDYYSGGLIKYFNSIKIKEARRLIRDTKMNMTEISDYLSFDNPQYFSKCFNKFTNMTPSQYKQSIVKKI